MTAETRAGLLASQWKIFLDGVEVPHHGFSMVMSQDQVSEVMLSLEPDKILLELRPQTMVHIFAKDRFPDPAPGQEDEEGGVQFAKTYTSDEDELKDTWHLFWEGVAAGRTHQKSKGNRSIQVRARALVESLERTPAFMMGMGGIEYSSIASGSRLPATVAGVIEGGGPSSVDTLSLFTLADLFTNDGETGSDVPGRDSATPRFAERLIRLITYLSSYNGVLRQHVVRGRLLNKIASIPDSILEGILERSVGLSLLGDMQNRITSRSSVLDIIRQVMSYGFYHLVQVPMPYRPSKQPEMGSMIPTLTGKQDEEQATAHQIPYEYYRNDYVFVPETYYALPPPCNFVFPDEMADLSIGREFQSEPTRHLVQDPHLASFVGNFFYWLAPEDIIRKAREGAGDDVTSANLFAMASTFGRSINVSGATSPYAYPDSADLESGSVRSLLGAVSDLELEKGIVPSFGQNRFEALAAAAYLSRTIPRTEDQATAQSIEDFANPENAAYADLMAAVANYQLQLMRYRRQGQVSMLGHRWIIPGLPTIIFDSDISYFGQVVSTTFVVNSDGQESTTLQLDRTRPVPKMEIEEIRAALEGLSTKLQELQTQKSKVADQALGQTISSALSGPLASQTTQYGGLGAKIEQTQSALQNWNTYIGGDTVDLVTTTGAPIQETLTIEGTQFDGTGLTTYFQDLSTEAAEIQAGLDELLVDGAAVAKALNTGEIAVGGSAFSTTLTKGDQTIYAAGNVSPAYLAYLFLDVPVLVDTTGQITAAKAALGDGFSVSGLKSALGSIVNGGASSDVFTGGEAPNTVAGALAVLTVAATYYELATAAIVEWLTIQKDIADSGENLDFLDLPPSTQAAADQSYKDQYQTIVDTLTNEIIEDGQKVLEDFDTRLDWPAPPAFFSEDLIATEKLDDLYQTSFGCKPFYTGPYTATATNETVAAIRASLTELDLGELETESGLSMQDRLEYYLEYLSGVSALNNVYPILEGQEELTDDVAPPPSWHDVAAAGGGQATPFEWAHRTFLKREATSLGQFLEDHKLELVTQFADRPTTKEFYQMRPVSGSQTTTGAGLVFDDSLFSKLVDEKKMTNPASTVVSDVLEQVLPGPFNAVAASAVDAASSDPLIQEAREQATNKYLTTQARQELILSYARKHFGDRGFDGT